MELEDEKHKGKETEMWEKAWRAWRNQNKVDRKGEDTMESCRKTPEP